MWYQKLNWLLNALNSAVHQSTKATPLSFPVTETSYDNVPDVAEEIDFDFLEDDDSPDDNMVEDVSWAQEIEDTVRSLERICRPDTTIHIRTNLIQGLQRG